MLPYAPYILASASSLLDKDNKDADGAEGHQPIKPHQHDKTSIVYRRAHEAALRAPPWSTTHNTFIVTNLTSVLGVLLIAVHSLPLYYRPNRA
jgi:hypothetical protein